MFSGRSMFQPIYGAINRHLTATRMWPCICLKRTLTSLNTSKTELTSPLSVGAEYELSFFVSHADLSEIATNGFGVLFSTLPFSSQGLIQAQPQFLVTDIVYEQEDWTQLTGTFIADDIFTHLTVGNFISQTNAYLIDTVIQNITPNTGTYYFDAFDLQPTGRRIDISADVINECFPVRVIFEAENIDSGSDWQWTFSDGDIKTGQSVIRSFFSDIDLDVQLTVVENGINYSIDRKYEIRGTEPSVANFSSPESVFVGDSVYIVNESMSATDYIWNFGDGDMSTSPNPVHAYDTPGTYIIHLSASTDGRCSDETSKTISVRCKDIITANTFTPNNDGSNDVFPFDGLYACGGNISIHIFTKLGKVVYESTDSGKAWTGDNLPSGIYYYVVHYEGGTENGFIHLLR